jgi:hypothetical protein
LNAKDKVSRSEISFNYILKNSDSKSENKLPCHLLTIRAKNLWSFNVANIETQEIWRWFPEGNSAQKGLMIENYYQRSYTVPGMVIFKLLQALSQ